MGADIVLPHNRPLVVEFLGVPGSGKSTLAHLTVKALQSRALGVKELSYHFDHVLSPGARVLAKLCHCLRGIVASPIDSVFWMRVLLDSDQRELRDIPRLAVNWFYTHGAQLCLARKSAVQVWDQGIFQAIWSIAYRSRCFSDIPSGQLTARLARTFVGDVVVVVVEVDYDTVGRRLLSRSSKASRLERDLAVGGSEAPLHAAFDCMRLVQGMVESLVSICPGRFRLIKITNPDEKSPEQTALSLADTIANLGTGEA